MAFSCCWFCGRPSYLQRKLVIQLFAVIEFQKPTPKGTTQLWQNGVHFTIGINELMNGRVEFVNVSSNRSHAFFR
jgi:hypothetical protein